MSRLLQGGEPCNASAFLDAGVASMWYTVRRGSGIFYRLGRVKVAPGKTALVADLLREVARRPALAAAWPRIATRANLFAAPTSSAGASADAQRIEAVANGSASCVEAKLQPCRCRYVLHDAWDDAMVWMARALGYETLLITATLLCNQPMDVEATFIGRGNGDSSGSPPSPPGSRGFATAYPELVDVRPLDEAMVHDQARGEHSYLQEADSNTARVGDAATVELRSRRKRPDVADAWVRQMHEQRLLTLRDPFDLSNELRTRPCAFSVHRWTMQCANHVSSRWPQSAWARCGIVGCGYVTAGAASRSARRSARNESTASNEPATPPESSLNLDTLIHDLSLIHI